MQTTQRVVATPKALELISKLQGEYGEIIFHQSGGCCDGSVPLCYEKGDFRIGENDVELGNLGGALFYMHHNQYDYYKHAQIIIDTQEGHGSEFSLEYGSGKRFVFELRLFTEEELKQLQPL